jgi:hypothetical protein
MVAIMNLIPVLTQRTPVLLLSRASSYSKITAASAATVATTPTAATNLRGSEAKPTISAVVANKIQKPISTERIPRHPAVIRRGHEPRGELVPSRLTHCLSRWAPSVNERIRALNF